MILVRVEAVKNTNSAVEKINNRQTKLRRDKSPVAKKRRERCRFTDKILYKVERGEAV